MKLCDMTKEEIEQMSYSELTEQILKENEPLSTLDIFHKICKLLDLDEETYADKIGDYYTSLATDKTFILLPDGKWDLQNRHPVNVNLEEEEIDDDEDLETIEEENAQMEEMASDIDDMDDASDIDDEDADDLTIVSEEELED